jgi:hypothetical protein
MAMAMATAMATATATATDAGVLLRATVRVPGVPEFGVTTIAKDDTGEWTPGDYTEANDLVCKDIRNHGSWEPHQSLVTAAILRAASPRATFVDIGAHVGYYCGIAAALGCGRVVGVECSNGITLEALGLNFSAWRATATTTTPTPTMTTFELINACAGQGAGETTLDDVLGADGRAALVKVDVEGAEREVVAGGERALRSHRVGALIVEMTPRRGARKRCEDILAFLQGECAYLVHDLGLSPPRLFGATEGETSLADLIGGALSREAALEILGNVGQTNFLFIAPPA